MRKGYIYWSVVALIFVLLFLYQNSLNKNNINDTPIEIIYNVEQKFLVEKHEKFTEDYNTMINEFNSSSFANNEELNNKLDSLTSKLEEISIIYSNPELLTSDSIKQAEIFIGRLYYLIDSFYTSLEKINFTEVKIGDVWIESRLLSTEEIYRAEVFSTEVDNLMEKIDCILNDCEEFKKYLRYNTEFSYYTYLIKKQNERYHIYY